MAEMTSLHMYLFTNEQIFVNKRVFTVFRKKEKKTHKTFPMFETFSLKMNAHFEKESNLYPSQYRHS